ncbi:hypothetical protein RMATCC62417_16722 [Rhizopus microsporus]|nr:hypothetical protein RMATCC62417_16722 [Rhizopus microsporus]
MDKRVTNSAALPQGLLENWNLFRQSHRSVIYTKKLVSGASQCLSEACIQLAATYTNCIVESFEARLLKYLSYLIQNTFVSMAYQGVKKIAYDYCYQSNYQYNLRGTKYDIPRPKGGRKANNIVLREDQREYIKANQFKKKKALVDMFDPDFIPLYGKTNTREVTNNMFGTDVIGFGRRNPNAYKKKK